MGTLECRLCATVHATEGSYMSHTQGRRHQTALQRRAERDRKMAASTTVRTGAVRPLPKKSLKIGRPGYKVVKFAHGGEKGLEFELNYPDIEPGLQPRHSFMSAFEQRVEVPDRNFQYLVFAVQPYETVAFKIPNLPVEKAAEKFYTKWNKETKTFTLRLMFKQKPVGGEGNEDVYATATTHVI